MSLRVSRQVLEAFGRPVGLATTPSLPVNPSLLLAVNWRNGLEVETSWNTIISKNPATLAEERISVLDRPYRRVQASFFSKDHEETAYLSWVVQSFCSGSFAFPLFSDVAITSQASSGTKIYGDFVFRRFFTGQLVAILSSSGVQYRELTQVREGSLTFSTSVTVKKDVLVYPLVWCDPLTEVGLDCQTDHLFGANLDCLEANKNTALPATWTGYIEGPFPYFLGLPVLDTEPNWVSGVSVNRFRESQQYSNYVSRQQQLHGTKPLFAGSLNFCFDSRELFWKHLNFFDSRQGKTRPFYVPDPLEPWRRSSFPSTTEIEIRADFPEAALDTLDQIAVRNQDYNLSSFHSVSSITPGSGVFTLTVSPPMNPVWLSHQLRVTPLHLCRFDSDSMVESWETTEVCTTTLSVRQIENEQAAELS